MSTRVTNRTRRWPIVLFASDSDVTLEFTGETVTWENIRHGLVDGGADDQLLEPFDKEVVERRSDYATQQASPTISATAVVLAPGHATIEYALLPPELTRVAMMLPTAFPQTILSTPIGEETGRLTLPTSWAPTVHFALQEVVSEFDDFLTANTTVAYPTPARHPGPLSVRISRSHLEAQASASAWTVATSLMSSSYKKAGAAKQRTDGTSVGLLISPDRGVELFVVPVFDVSRVNARQNNRVFQDVSKVVSTLTGSARNGLQTLGLSAISPLIRSEVRRNAQVNSLAEFQAQLLENARSLKASQLQLASASEIVTQPSKHPSTKTPTTVGAVAIPTAPVDTYTPDELTSITAGGRFTALADIQGDVLVRDLGAMSWRTLRRGLRNVPGSFLDEMDQRYRNSRQSDEPTELVVVGWKLDGIDLVVECATVGKSAKRALNAKTGTQRTWLANAAGQGSLAWSHGIAVHDIPLLTVDPFRVALQQKRILRPAITASVLPDNFSGSDLSLSELMTRRWNQLDDDTTMRPEKLFTYLSMSVEDDGSSSLQVVRGVKVAGLRAAIEAAESGPLAHLRSWTLNSTTLNGIAEDDLVKPYTGNALYRITSLDATASRHLDSANKYRALPRFDTLALAVLRDGTAQFGSRSRRNNRENSEADIEVSSSRRSRRRSAQHLTTGTSRKTTKSDRPTNKSAKSKPEQTKLSSNGTSLTRSRFELPPGIEPEHWRAYQSVRGEVQRLYQTLIDDRRSWMPQHIAELDYQREFLREYLEQIEEHRAELDETLKETNAGVTALADNIRGKEHFGVSTKTIDHQIDTVLKRYYEEIDLLAEQLGRLREERKQTRRLLREVDKTIERWKEASPVGLNVMPERAGDLEQLLNIWSGLATVRELEINIGRQLLRHPNRPKLLHKLAATNSQSDEINDQLARRATQVTFFHETGGIAMDDGAVALGNPPSSSESRDIYFAYLSALKGTKSVSSAARLFAPNAQASIRSSASPTYLAERDLLTWETPTETETETAFSTFHFGLETNIETLGRTIMQRTERALGTSVAD